MPRPLGQHILRYGVAVLTILGFVTTVAALAEGATPIALGSLVFAFGAATWLIRGNWSDGHLSTPNPWRTALVISLTLLSGFAVAWYERRPEAVENFEFVVVPNKGEFVLESVAPVARTEIFPGLQLRYGARVWVTCSAQDDKGHAWLRLTDHRFLRADDLQPVPYTEAGQPPRC